ncbi:MAG: tetratricopeptide repeat protein [Burkholderiaceae bacterium]|jgi:predicted negative regulator of RcsB-dependent stress response|nr:tetratricopeptide repeat protein [Aquabacterium sp.]NUP84316.1 tetratricopeptide repeat protein [Burkholderiaceae bacterium]
MANPLDLQEQEQLDELKAFWKQYGNAITWALTLALLAFSGWSGWGWWQREQGVKAGAMFEELDKAAAAGDAERAQRVMTDLKERHPGTTYAHQGALLAARVLAEKGRGDDARAALTWVAEQAPDDAYRALARLRLAALLLDAKKHDEALKALDVSMPEEFTALVADRRGDVLLAMKRRDEAVAAYRSAYQGLDDKVDYRRLVEAKLAALGAAVAASGATR